MQTVVNERENTDIDAKIAIATEGLAESYGRILSSHENRGNALSIAKFLITCHVEKNLSLGYKQNLIYNLCKLSSHAGKSFIDFNQEDIISFLNTKRRPESEDPDHSWIGTYNQLVIYICKFFKWLYNPNLPEKERNKKKPECIQNIPTLGRKEKSHYQASDMWTAQDDLIFLKYCPSLRDKCYHMVARDSSCRPSEILNLKVKSLIFKLVEERQYVEISVNGKTGKRTIPLIDSLPYVKDWLDYGHPQRNPNAYFICALGKSIGRKLNRVSMFNTFDRYKKQYFPKLLKDPSIPSEDKKAISELLRKPWNLYIKRHSALTQKSKILKEAMLRVHAGWTIRSNMPEKYLHYFGNESSESLLEAYGLKPKLEQIDKLKPKQCPNCNESNKVDSKFCAKCRMILSFDGYMETVEEKAKKESEVKTLSEKYDKDMKELREQMEHRFNQILQKIDVKKLE